MAKSKSTKQARLMAACAHGSSYSKCPPKNVAQKFNKADEGSGILSQAAKEINRNARGDRFAKGLRKK